MSWRFFGGLLVVSAVGGFLAGLYQGYHRTTPCELELSQAKTALAKAQAQSQGIQAAQAAITPAVVTRYVDRAKVIQERGQSIVQKVPVYVQADASSTSPSASHMRAALPGAFRVLHDATATSDAGTTSDLPDPTRAADAPAVAVEDVATTIIGNYTTCHLNAEKLRHLQEWVAREHSLAHDQD